MRRYRIIFYRNGLEEIEKESYSGLFQILNDLNAMGINEWSIISINLVPNKVL